MKNTKPHPLESIVWKAFAEHDHQDASSLGYFFAGACVRGGSHAYHTVAKDCPRLHGEPKEARTRRTWLVAQTTD